MVNEHKLGISPSNKVTILSIKTAISATLSDTAKTANSKQQVILRFIEFIMMAKLQVLPKIPAAKITGNTYS
jgi:hypothetical protein